MFRARLSSDISQIAPASQNYVTVGLAVYIPFWRSEPTITKFFWVNGTAVAGNLDIGIYASDGTLPRVPRGRSANETVTDPKYQT